MSFNNNNPENIPPNKSSNSKEETILILKKTIAKLIQVKNQINNQSLNDLPNEDIVNNLVNNTDQLLRSFETNKSRNIENINSDKKDQDDWDDLLEETPPVKVKYRTKKIKKVRSNRNIFTQIKSIFTKPVIFILLIAIAIAFFFTIKIFVINKPQEIVNNVPSENVKIVEKNDDLKIKEEPKNEENLDKIREEKPLENELKEEEKITNISEELNPENEENLETIIPISEPELTPEQNLIVSIKKEILAVTNEYADGLILTIEANFNSGYLTINIDDNWYEINESKQDLLAQEIFKQAQILDFYKLNIKDTKGNLIARSPIVGNEMIIMRR